jgi:uncharacterized membrane protein YozB (DUF420 family)
MLAACALALGFMVGFVLRFVWYGPTKLEHAAWVKVPFYLLYFTHEPLAVVNVFLVVAALVLGLLGRYRQHREIAPVAFWIWVYVSVSGIAIFLFLYPGRAPLLGIGAPSVTRDGRAPAGDQRQVTAAGSSAAETSPR